MKNLPVQSLEFDQIKANFKDFLKGNPDYKDFNFEASGISTVLNIASYQTHYIGYFVKMLLDEAFADSAHTRSALLSHAKGKGMLPKGRKSSRAEVQLKVITDLTNEPLSRSIALDRGMTFNSTNASSDFRTFAVQDGTILYDRQVDGQVVTYTSDVISISEGTFRTWNFLVDASILYPKFSIRDENIDIDTLRVRVRENDTSTEYVEYTLATSIDDLSPTSKAFFVSTDENENYQIFFGNNVFGIQPQGGNAIECTFMSCSGVGGDGAKTFSFNRPDPDGPGSIGTYSNFQTITTNQSAGGAEPQSVEDLRFTIPNNFKRQNRTVTPGDFRSILTEEFRNIDSMNVWGGETNAQRDYGKIYISIKPKNADRLTAISRQNITNDLVHKYGIVGIDPVFVDPDFINVTVTIIPNLDLRKTNKSTPEIEAYILNRLNLYNTSVLNRFDSMLSDVDMLNFIKNGESYFTSLYSVKVLNKQVTQLHNSTTTQLVNFGNQLVPGTISSTAISYSTFTAQIKDDGKGLLNLIDTATGKVLVKAGTINYTNGQLNYTLPAAARAAGYESSTTGIIGFNASPVNPDVSTYLNNIVRISASKVGKA